MAISYDGLFRKLNSKHLTLYDFLLKFDMSLETGRKFRKNLPLSLRTLEKVCNFLDCNIGDVVEFVPEKETDSDV